MVNDAFLLALAALSIWILTWGFRTLPQEQWQIAAAVPIAKDDSGQWRGLNLTYYGMFHASAYVAGVALMFVLLGAVGIPLRGSVTMAVLLLFCCVPASKLVARLVEKKRATFTVGGAVFVGVLLGPWVFLWANRTLGPALGFDIPIAATLAAAAIGYALGEGIGRLACVSFGCCYGQPLSRVAPWLQRLLQEHSFIFLGKTKKVAYEGGLEGEKVVPIQAITATLFVATALLSSAIFLRGHHRAALGLAFVVTQSWRSFSETLRADYRGKGKLSAYQIMALLALPYLLALLPFLPKPAAQPADVLAGLRSLWDPWMILCMQGLWCAIFFYTGRSVVTEATLSFHVRQDRI